MKKATLKAYETLGKERVTRRAPRKRPLFETLLTLAVGCDLPNPDVWPTLQKLRDHYIDWNEVRVTNVFELARQLTRLGLPNPLERARRLRSLLQDIFQYERKFTFSMFDGMPPERVRRFLLNFKSLDPALCSASVHLALDMPATPVSAGMLRVFRRMGVIQPGEMAARVQKDCDEFVAPGEMYAFWRAFDEHAREICREDGYDCTVCSLRSQCKTGLKARAAKPKPRPAAEAKARKPAGKKR